MKKVLVVLLMIVLGPLAGYSKAENGKAENEVVSGIPATDTVTLVDLGARSCIPCKMMAPILEELKEEYKGRAELIFIDVREKVNKEKARAFKVRGIPTQIFFDKKGLEVYRHVGFLDKDSIVNKLEELLAD